MSKQLLLAVALLLSAGCGGAADEARVDADSAQTAAPPPPMTPEELLESQRRQLAQDSLDFERRRASMTGYRSCMAQAEGASDEVRSRIEEACARLPDAPRR